VRRHHHAGADLARARALAVGERHQRGGPLRRDDTPDGRPGTHALTAFTARSIDSGVAGASSGTGAAGLRLWIASAIAAKTQIATSSRSHPAAVAHSTTSPQLRRDD